MQLVSVLPMPAPYQQNHHSSFSSVGGPTASSTTSPHALAPFVTSIRWCPQPLSCDLSAFDDALNSHLRLAISDRQGRIALWDFRIPPGPPPPLARNRSKLGIQASAGSAQTPGSSPLSTVPPSLSSGTPPPATASGSTTPPWTTSLASAAILSTPGTSASSVSGASCSPPSPLAVVPVVGMATSPYRSTRSPVLEISPSSRSSRRRPSEPLHPPLPSLSSLYSWRGFASPRTGGTSSSPPSPRNSSCSTSSTAPPSPPRPSPAVAANSWICCKRVLLA